MRPCASAWRAAAASTSSRLCVGTSVMLELRPGAWPERPARCTSRATPLAEPICSTCSTGKKSTPRSRLDVHTTALSCPAFRPCSTQSRTSCPSDPWCNAMVPAQSGRASSSAWYHRSACDRVLVNTKVDAAASIDCTTCGSRLSPMWPAHAKRSARAGSITCTSSRLSMRPCTSTAGGGCGVSGTGCGSKVCRASSRLPSVADMPHTCSAGFQPDRRASASCTCTPRLLPTSSCHSSTTTRRTLARRSRASARASSSDTLSGVVTSSVGRRRSCAARSPLAVSPVRSPLVQVGARSGSGACRARSESAANARMGVIHSTERGGAAARRVRSAVRALGASSGAGAASARARCCSAPSHTA